MIVILPVTKARDITADMFTDITTVQVIDIGQTAQGEPYVEFASDLTVAEQDAVRRRMRTSSAVEEELHRLAHVALDANRTFRDTTVTQLRAGAQKIIDDASITSGEVPGYLKDLATGVRTLTNHLDMVNKENIHLIRLVLRLLDSTN